MGAVRRWREVRLGGCVDLVAGFAFKSKRFTDDPNDIALVKGANVHQGYIDWTGARRWPAAEFEEYRRFELLPGDVVIAMDRPWIEAGLKWSWIRDGDPQAMLVQRVARLRGTNGPTTDYLRYVVGSPGFTNYIKPIVTGINVPHISGDQIKAFRLQLPPVSTQRRIASILSAYDDLIENNERRTRILEEMARRLYREWFVHFRFPGHERVKLVDSAVGRVPEGWEVKRLSDVCSLVMGQSPKSEFYNTDGIGLPFHQGVTDFGPHFPRDRVYCTVRNRLAESGDILFSVRAPVGRINIADKRIVIGRGLSAIRRLDGAQWFLFRQLKDKFKEEDTMGGGTIFKTVTKADMERIELLCPPAVVVARFEALAEPMEHLIGVLTRKNDNLHETRDLLLPKLVSGALAV